MRIRMTEEQLRETARQLRIDVIESLFHAGSGHPGGSLSAAEIMSALYFDIMDVDPEQPSWEGRDRFVLSKGHAAPIYYAALAERGFFPRAELKTLRKIDSRLQGHPDRKRIPGVDMSTGSLGQGISAAAGMAAYAKREGKDFRVYCLIGDGEMQEGQLWEAMMAAAHYRLGNLTVLLDNNNLQIDGSVDQVMSIYPVKEKAQAFGWRVLEVDGHNAKAISEAIELSWIDEDTPTLIQCKTIKGRGVHFMEHQAAWHGGTINKEQYLAAMAELSR